MNKKKDKMRKREKFIFPHYYINYREIYIFTFDFIFLVER